VFTADNAHGPDTFRTGSGVDYVSVHNGSGDPDSVDCTSSDGLAALYFNPSDHLDPRCKLNVFVRTLPVLTKALRRLGPAAASSPTIHLTGLRVPAPGRSRRSCSCPRAHGAGTAATGAITFKRSGAVTLTLHVSHRGHTLLRFAMLTQLHVEYTPRGGRKRVADLHV
jgi:hypothetical protein